MKVVCKWRQNCHALRQDLDKTQPGWLVQQMKAKIPQNSSHNHASIKFGTDILKGPLFHKRAIATQKFKMAAIHWPIA